jgi:hypothetical protein
MLKGATKRQRGQTLIESSLVLLTYLSMLIFVMDMGRFLATQQYISDRVRNGARWASVNTWDPTAIANYVCYNDPAPRDGSPAGLFGLAPSMVSVTQAGTAGGWDHRVVVTVQNYPRFLLVPFISGKYAAPPISVSAPMASAGVTN